MNEEIILLEAEIEDRRKEERYQEIEDQLIGGFFD
jgi:hypothetical protein